MVSEKKKEVLRVVKFVMFSISAGIIEIVSFTILNEFTGMEILALLSDRADTVSAVEFHAEQEVHLQVGLQCTGCHGEDSAVLLRVHAGNYYNGNYLAEDLLWNDYIVTGINMGLNITTEYLYDRSSFSENPSTLINLQ